MLEAEKANFNIYLLWHFLTLVHVLYIVNALRKIT